MASAHTLRAPPGGSTMFSPRKGPLTLLTLPVELRNIIYDFTFSEVVGISHWGAHDNTPLRCNGTLLLVCKQIREEAEKDYYRRTTFSVIPSHLVSWYLELPAKHRKEVRSVRVWTFEWENKPNHERAMILDQLRQGVAAIVGGEVKQTVLKTWFGEGEPEVEEIADVGEERWKWVKNVANGGSV